MKANRIHILGMCGTFMSGIALLAKQSGYIVSGSDENVYPPMSDQLNREGIKIYDGYRSEDIPADVDCVLVGNVIKRGNPALEYVLDQRIPYTSGPEWLFNHILCRQYVLAVAGTHGKTTTTSMLTHILDVAGFSPGFLIGGVPENFGVSARLGNNQYFVIEADEYDSAFFDKRAKFIHYRPRTLVLNNLEYDHADIFPDLAAVKQQFHYLVRTLAGNSKLIVNQADENIQSVLAMGNWSEVIHFGETNAIWTAKKIAADGSSFEILYRGQYVGGVNWSLLGNHNIQNAIAAIAAAASVGVNVEAASFALTTFKNVKRRLERRGVINEIVIYDDFAHHPTAIAATLQALRANIGNKRLIAVLELGSYTMRKGVHKEQLLGALQTADMIVCKNTELDWGLREILASSVKPAYLYENVDGIVQHMHPMLKPGDHVVVMSNSGFGGIHEKLMHALSGVQ